MKKRGIDKAYIVFFIIIAVLTVILLTVKFAIHPITVSGSSMEPTYKDGNVLLTKEYTDNETVLKVNDVVVFSYQGSTLIKRVIGLSGDRILIKDGALYRNGMMISDGYDKMEEAGLATNEITVPAGSIFVLGDNRNDSVDSRKIGMISTLAIQYVITGKLF